eukprot:764811-Hanusia_phi.AAC.5
MEGKDARMGGNGSVERETDDKESRRAIGEFSLWMASTRQVLEVLDSREAVNLSSPPKHHEIDGIFLSNLKSNKDTFVYLVQTFSRAAQHGDQDWAHYVKRQCVAYSALALLQPGNFAGASAPPPDYASLKLFLLLEESGQLRAPPGFVQELLSKLETLELPSYPTPHGCLKSLTLGNSNSVIPSTISRLSKKQVTDNIAAEFLMMEELCNNKAAMKLLFESQYWNPKGVSFNMAQVIEMKTILGSFLRLSCYPESQIVAGQLQPIRHPVGQDCFSDCVHKAKLDIDSSVSQASQMKTLNMMKIMLKEPSAQQEVFSWIATVLKHNEIRLKLGYHVGYLMARVLLKLCKPFADPDHPKALWHKIDSTWLLSKHRMDLSNETRLATTRGNAQGEKYAVRTSILAQLDVGSFAVKLVKPRRKWIMRSTLKCLNIVHLSQQIKDYAKISRELQERNQSLNQSSEDFHERMAEIAVLVERRLCYDVV